METKEIEAKTRSPRIGEFCVLQNHICLLTASKFVQKRKHARVKYELTGIEISTGNTYKELIFPNSFIEVPIRSVCYLVEIEEESCKVASEMDLENTRIVELPRGGIGEVIRDMVKEGSRLNLTTLTACGKDTIVAAVSQSNSNFLYQMYLSKALIVLFPTHWSK